VTPERTDTLQMMPSKLPFRLHHIGFVVPTLDAGQAMFRIMGFDVSAPAYTDPVQKVTVQFIQPASDVLVELIAPADEKSPVSRFLAKQGAGLHHLCYEVFDIDAASEFLRQQGSVVTCAPVGAVAFGGRRIAFHYWQRQIVELLEMEKSIP
jgi:methylmalonyl-CoA/ethylmalonyl-CoA epimerase